MENIKMEPWYWSKFKESEKQNNERELEVKKNRRHARFLKWARRILLAEATCIGVEVLYKLGHFVRGYDSIGGEGLLVIALAGAAAYWFWERAR